MTSSNGQPNGHVARANELLDEMRDLRGELIRAVSCYLDQCAAKEAELANLIGLIATPRETIPIRVVEPIHRDEPTEKHITRKRGLHPKGTPARAWRFLRDLGQPASIAEISQALEVNQHNVQEACSRLVRKGHLDDCVDSDGALRFVVGKVVPHIGQTRLVTEAR